MADTHDENAATGMTPKPELPSMPIPLSEQPLAYWLQRFFACNPFYLISAALLLYGVYRVSADDGLLHREIFQLLFNFGSLQLYEALLVVTAIMLARRRIWYDSLLLVGLENLLVLVPFILISQAALLNQRIVWVICLAGGLAATGRFWGLKRHLRELNLPRRALVMGLVLLVINVALPLVFRHLHESKIGTKPTEGAAYEMNRCSWLLLLPAMFALVNLLPRPRACGELLPQRGWLPTGLFGLWLAASAAHLFSLSYVYNFDWEPAFKVPLLWVVLWTAYRRHKDFMKQPVPWLEKILLAPPALVTLLVMNETDRPVFLALMVLNLSAYTLVLVKERGNRTALFLLFATVQGLIAALWKQAGPDVPVFLRREEWVAASTAILLLYWVVRSRNPKAGLLGFLIIGIAGGQFTRYAIAWDVTFQLAFAFLVLHSLRWNEAGVDAAVFRVGACAGWLGHAFFLTHSGAAHALPLVYLTGSFALAICVLARFFAGSWKPIAAPITAGLVLLSHPADLLAGKLFTAPAGLLAVTGSFVVFALGTLAALTKSRWGHPAARAVRPRPTAN